MAQTTAERESAYRSAREQQERLHRLISLHRRDWPGPQPIAAPPRATPDAPRLPAEPKHPGADRFAKPLLDAIPRWRIGERRVARRLAGEQADEAHRRAVDRHRDAVAVHERRMRAHAVLLDRISHEHDAEQRLLGHVHERLLTGDRAAGERAIAAALPELPALTRLAGWHGEEPVVVVIAPGTGTLPEREPDRTAGGKPTTRKLSQTERNEHHAELLASLTLAAARRALAAAPAVRAVVAATVDSGAVLAHCRVTREAPAPPNDALVALYELDGELEQTGRTGTVAPLDVSGRAELRSLGAERPRGGRS